MQTITFTKSADALGMINDQEVIDAIKNLPPGNWEVEIRKPKRTNAQNLAMHLYFTQVAEELEAAGFDKLAVLQLMKENMPWSPDSVKEDIWKNFMRFKGFGEKTSKMNSDQVTVIYELTNLFLTTRLGMESILFPSMDSLYAKQLNR